MSIRTMITCEMCPNNFTIPFFDAKAYEYETPPDWIMLVQGNPQEHTAQHFCGKDCLGKWLGVESYHPPFVAYDAPPPTKMRRFLLVDENAEITEGIKYSNGSVSIHTLCDWSSWDSFKRAHDGSGIQWIDQEVNDGK